MVLSLHLLSQSDLLIRATSLGTGRQSHLSIPKEKGGVPRILSALEIPQG